MKRGTAVRFGRAGLGHVAHEESIEELGAILVEIVPANAAGEIELWRDVERRFAEDRRLFQAVMKIEKNRWSFAASGPAVKPLGRGGLGMIGGQQIGAARVSNPLTYTSCRSPVVVAVERADQPVQPIRLPARRTSWVHTIEFVWS